MSGGTFYAAAGAGAGFAAVVAYVGVRALRHAKTLEVFERPAQAYLLQVNPPGEKVLAMSLPVRTELGAELQHEKQA